MNSVCVGLAIVDIAHETTIQQHNVRRPYNTISRCCAHTYQRMVFFASILQSILAYVDV